MVESLLTGIATKLAALGLVAKAGLGLTMAAVSVGGAAAAGVPAAQDVVEAVSPVDFAEAGEDAEEIQQVSDQAPPEEELTDELTASGEVEGDVIEPAGPPAGTKGAEVSNLARTTPGSPEKGKVISAVASEGKSRAGTRGSGQGGGGSAPFDTRSSGGTATADEASGGASSQGTQTADEASGGRSAAGSANAGPGLFRRP